ncbi:LAME_0G06722g1_1 [Lachancea meyersii CBS 8951]|uniref:LAME_0G06722g1_1 n=1 Tax=Lachancea meyersii CBS 8951 TaxID=1266667 RepID=A0A1G4K7N4_9SACH|nr:LAME_0G06722g1_1 [Lachancea meyersii CBS 8951]
MNYIKNDDHLSINSSMAGDENYSGMPGSFEHGLRTRHSSKKSDSLFTQRDNQYHGIKDSLLLYEGQSFELAHEKASDLPRRQMSGARDNTNPEKPTNNFNCGRHVWYRGNNSYARGPSEDGAEILSPNNSPSIRDVLENAAHSIAKSQKACLGIKESLRKYSSPTSVRIPGSFSAVEASAVHIDRDTHNDGELGQRESATKSSSIEPIAYLPICLLSPIVIKTLYFLLAQSVTLESRNYSFTGTCAMIVNAELSGFTLSQLDNLVLQITEIWLLIKTMPILIKAPWRFYATAMQYASYPLMGEDLYQSSDALPFPDVVALFKRHETFGLRLQRASLIVLLLSPILLTSGLLLAHTLTLKLATYDLSICTPWSVYSSFMAIVFSRSQFAMLIWCIWYQYCKDAFEHFEKYVIDQQKTFLKDAEFIAERLEQTDPAAPEGLDAGTKQSIISRRPFFPTRKNVSSPTFEATHPVDSPSSKIQIPPFAMAAYESPLKSKRVHHTPRSTIQPVSPQAGPPPPADRPTGSRNWIQYLGIVARLPLFVLSLKYKMCRLGLKVGVYVSFFSYWLILGRWRSSRSINAQS